MKDIHACNWFHRYDNLKILAILAISPKPNIIVAKFFEILLVNNVTLSGEKAKIILKLFEFIFSDFLLKAVCQQNFLKLHFGNATSLQSHKK